MSNPNTFMNTFASNIVQFMQLATTLRTQNDQLAQDPTIVDRYFAQTPQENLGGIPRKDITADDVHKASEALVQVFFTLDSGAPTTKQALYKMQP